MKENNKLIFFYKKLKKIKKVSVIRNVKNFTERIGIWKLQE